MVEHTPGPWTADTNERHQLEAPYYVWGPHGSGHGIVCELPTVVRGELMALTDAETRQLSADARLIAAAPDMLAALEDTLTFLDGFYAFEDGGVASEPLLTTITNILNKIKDQPNA